MADKIASQSPPGLKDIAALAWPMGINAMLLQGAVVIDGFLVSPLGESALASMGLATSIGFLLVGLLFAFSNATQILVSQAQGASNRTALKTALTCGIVICFSAITVGLALAGLFGPRLIDHFAHSPEIASNAKSYLLVFACAIVCESISQPMTCYFNGTGQTRLPLYSRLVELPINVGLSVVLIYGLYGFPELGVVGAAVGSAVAAVLRLAFLTTCVARFEQLMLSAPGWSQQNLQRSVQRQLVFSLPIVGTFYSVSMANSICGLLYARMSLPDFAAMTLIMPWLMVLGHFMMTWAQATGIFVGQLLGGNADGRTLNAFLSRAWRMALLLGGFVSLLYLGASLAFPVIYADLQVETLAALWSFVPSLVLLTFPKISNAICGNTLRAGGDTVMVMNIFVIDQWVVRLPLTAVLILYLDAPAGWVFAVFLIQEVVKFPMFHLRFYGGKWRNSLITD